MYRQLAGDRRSRETPHQRTPCGKAHTSRVSTHLRRRVGRIADVNKESEQASVRFRLLLRPAPATLACRYYRSLRISTADDHDRATRLALTPNLHASSLAIHRRGTSATRKPVGFDAHVPALDVQRECAHARDRDNTLQPDNRALEFNLARNQSGSTPRRLRLPP